MRTMSVRDLSQELLLRRTPNRARRRGTAAVELALCLPLLLATSLGMIEACNIVQVRTRMIMAAYESARLATRPKTSTKLTATSSEVISRCQNLLTQFQIQGATISLSPSDLSTLTPEATVTVTVQVPLSQNSASAYLINNNQTIAVQTTLVME